MRQFNTSFKIMEIFSLLSVSYTVQVSGRCNISSWYKYFTGELLVKIQHPLYNILYYTSSAMKHPL